MTCRIGIMITLAAAIGLSGCATIIRGTEQQVAVNTNPPGAKISFSNGQECIGPCLMNVKRNQSLIVTISKSGCQTQTASMVPTLAGGGILLGGLVDYGTGAVYDLQPNPLTVTLSCQEQPIYSSPPTFAPAVPAINSPTPTPERTYEQERAISAPDAVGGPAIQPTPAQEFWAEEPAAPPNLEPAIADVCAEYRGDQALLLRCQQITGVDRSTYVPIEGSGYPLADQMRCHPFRDDITRYSGCLAQG
jgi:hypothetical protein